MFASRDRTNTSRSICSVTSIRRFAISGYSPRKSSLFATTTVSSARKYVRVSLRQAEIAGELRMVERARDPELSRPFALHVRHQIAHLRNEIQRHAVRRHIERDLPVGRKARSGHASEREIDRNRSL